MILMDNIRNRMLQTYVTLAKGPIKMFQKKLLDIGRNGNHSIRNYHLRGGGGGGWGSKTISIPWPNAKYVWNI